MRKGEGDEDEDYTVPREPHMWVVWQDKGPQLELGQLVGTDGASRFWSTWALGSLRRRCQGQSGDVTLQMNKRETVGEGIICAALILENNANNRREIPICINLTI